MAVMPYHVPGVYYEPQPRTAEQLPVRTDVVGFIGFEPRVRNGTTPSTLNGSPAVGHAFRVDVSEFQVLIKGVLATVPATFDFPLSQSSIATPISNGQSIVYGLALAETKGELKLVAAAGAPTASGREAPPGDALLEAAVLAALNLAATDPHSSLRIADVTVRREVDAIFVTSRVTAPLSMTRCDDFRDYVLAFGEPQDDGTLLGPAIRAFFANGGRRCWVATLRRPDFEDQTELAKVLIDMVGLAGSSELEATGLERLLLVPEVTVVDLPDLYARRVDRTTRSIPLPPSEREACFLPCGEIPPKGTATSTDRTPAWKPIFESAPLFDPPVSTNAVFETQKGLLARCLKERWRVLLLLSVPLMPDAATGLYVPPTHADASDWVRQFDLLLKKAGFAETEEVACAALYWPWTVCQERVDGPILEMPPSPCAAGVIARRDLARGPQISPANETLREVVGLTAAVDDDVHARLYDPDPDAKGLPISSINVLRAFPGYGIQLWGARTLSTETWLRFVAVRRTLTAIELRMKSALDLLVFEPNTPALWLQITQTAFAVLMPLFESGALRGARPEDAFYVRCDETVNPPESVVRGELLIEVGVAVAAPAEFLVFRVGRREGVIEVLE